MIKRILVGLVLLIPLAAYASLPKTWGAEVLRYSDLNANFAHVEAALRGGTHTAIVNADISASAAIAHTKLASPHGLPKAFALVSTGPCPNSGTTNCTLSVSAGVTSVASATTTGRYNVTLSPLPPTSNFAVLLTPINTGAPGDIACSTAGHLGTPSTPSFIVRCITASTGAAVDVAGFSFAVIY